MILYCPSCGASHEYSLDKPKTCKKCGKAFAAAFKIVSPPAPVRYEDEDEAPIIQRPARKRVPQSFNPEIESEDDDPSQKELIKQEIIARLRASGGIKVARPARNSVKIGELCQNPDIIEQFENPTGPASSDGQQ